MNTSQTDLILQYILAVASENDWGEQELGPIHLIKYAYLADLDYARRNQGRTITGARWRFFHFGPWDNQILSRIEPALSAIGAIRKNLQSDKYGDFVRWSYRGAGMVEELEGQVDCLTALAIKNAVRTYGNDTSSLLNNVYQTLPMVHAAPNEYLDFSKAENIRPAPAINCQPEQFTAKQAKRRKALLSSIREEFQKRMAAKQAADRKKRDSTSQPVPQYDDIFFEGVKVLENLAGDEVPLGRMTCTFSDDFWKSKARYDPNLS